MRFEKLDTSFSQTKFIRNRANRLSVIPKRNILDYSRTELEHLFDALGEKSYRAAQLMSSVYHRNVDDFNLNTNFSKSLRARLSEGYEVGLPRVISQRLSADGTRKWIMARQDGNAIETVLIPDGRRRTLCISSQVGCSLDCSFCATGKQGFGGNLTTGEIVGQVLNVTRALEVEEGDASLTNVVFMGMGEPLLNFEATMRAADIFMDDNAFGLSKRRVTVSTAGVVPRIYDMCGTTEVSLAVSLHAATDELRTELVPLNRKHDISSLMAACRAYLQSLDSRRVITFEYTLIDSINDEPEHARQLHELVRDLRNKINLIPFNPYPGTNYRRPEPDRIKAFQKALLDLGQMATVRTTRGDDVNAACGQLVGDFRDRTRRRERHNNSRSAEILGSR